MATGRSNSKTSNGSGGADSVIGDGTRIRGRVLGEGNLTVEGHIEGDVTLRGDLTIAAGGSVTSNVEAESVLIAGALEGDVTARGPVRVSAGARVRGNLSGSEVSVEDGAEFAGRLDCAFDLPAELTTGSKEPARRRA